MWQGLAGQVFLKPHINLLPRCSGFDRPPVNWEEECCYGGLVITWQLATGSPWTNGHFDVSSQCCLMIEPSATFQNAKIEWKEKHRLIWACIDIVVHFRVQMASCWKNAFWPSCIVFLARRTTLGKKTNSSRILHVCRKTLPATEVERFCVSQIWVITRKMEVLRCLWCMHVYLRKLSSPL